MAGFLTPAGKAWALEALVGKAKAARTVYVGLAQSIPAVYEEVTLASIVEPTTAGYARAAVGWDDALVINDVVLIKNSDAESFGTVSEDLPACAYAFLCTSVSGSSGDILYVWELAEPVQALSGKPISAAAGGLIIE